ncbi:MAG: YdgA family protein [Helicobacteraceae bacterium]|jgi:hypothetical protein|nr:YdgA family protein [Helicobacteraceae bacterium]
MKKILAAAIIAVAVIAIVAPIVSGLVMSRALDFEKLNAKLAQQLGSEGQLEFRQLSYDKSLFGAKLVYAVTGDLFDGHSMLEIESDVSFGWYLTSDSPFVALFKSRDAVRISGEALESIRDELPDAIKDGVLLEGESAGIPYLLTSGKYATRDISYERGSNSLQIKPLTIDISVKGKSDISLTAEQPYIEFKEGKENFKISEIALKTNGDLSGRLDKDSEAEFTIAKIDINVNRRGGSAHPSVDNLKIKSAQKVKGGLIDSVVEFSADKFSLLGVKNALPDQQDIIVDKPYFAFSIVKADAKTLEEIQKRIEVIQSRQANNRRADEEIFGLVPDIIAVFDKGAIFSNTISFSLNDAPVNYYATLTTDPQVTLPAFNLSKDYINSLTGKLIIDVNLSVHQTALGLLEVPELFLGMAEASGFIKRDGDVWKSEAHFEKDQWNIHGEPLPFKGLFPEQTRQYDDYEDDYEDDYDEFELD